MSAPRHKRVGYALAVGLAMGLTGCAVLRIDVDVYKGPLANEEAVQMEQFAAMAIGAKPLLIALRDHLQWSDDDIRECARAKPGYRTSFFDKPPRATLKDPNAAASDPDNCQVTDSGSWTEPAGRVNAVLSLYDDKKLRGLEPYIEAGEAAIERYRDATAVFRDKAANREAWRRIQRGLVSTTASDFRDHIGVAQDADIEEIKIAFDVLVLAYKGLFGLEFDKDERETARKHEGQTRVDAIQISYTAFLRAAQFLRAAGQKVSAARLAQYEIGLLDDKCDKAHLLKDCPDQGSNHRYQELRKPHILDAQIRLLFDDADSAEAKLFRQKLVGFADGFAAARQALRDLWLNSLDALEFILDAPDFDDAEGVSVRFSFIEVIAFLTQNRHLVQALYFKGEPGPENNGFKSRLESDSKAWHANKDKNKEARHTFDYGTTRESLTRVLKKDPRDVVSWLRASDDWFITVSKAAFEDDRGKVAGDLVGEAKRKYGLVRGPTFGAGQLVGIMAGWNRVTSSAAVGLGGGRLWQGIETLIDEYLVQAARDPLARDRDLAARDRDEAKVRLRDALVRFSEKVLFIANNDKLLSPNGKGIDRYVLVLQAVGNSIQIQANELRARATFNEELQFREAPEIWAQEKVAKECADPPCREPYRLWSKDSAKGDGWAARSGRRSARQVLGDMIALLRYEHIQAVKAQGNDSDAARHLAQALAVAYEQRAGMAYIRPSGAYLRSSYPATSLQDDPRLGWRNMLTEHGLRTTPVIGEWLARGNQDDRARAKITAEIDKQFWQNINSVRVAGAGITNYVIVKDDIGNWYVKSYASDPAPIIKSAKSLAMFGIGQGFDPDLMKEALKDKKTDGDGPKKAEQPPPDPALGPVFKRKSDKYGKATDADFASAMNLIEDSEKSTMALDIENAWKNNPDTKLFDTELKSAFDIAFGEASRQAKSALVVPAGQADPGPRDKARRILAALGEIKRFHATLRAEIKTLELKGRADSESKSAQATKDALEKDRAKLEADLTKAKTDGAAAEDIAALEEKIETKNVEIATADTSVKELQVKAARAEAAEKAALREAGRIVNDTASRLIDRRLKAVADFEAAVLFISDANTKP